MLNVFTVKALLNPGDLFFVFLEGGLDREGGLFLIIKFSANDLLHSICVASIEKSVLPTSKVYVY